MSHYKINYFYTLHEALHHLNDEFGEPYIDNLEWLSVLVSACPKAEIFTMSPAGFKPYIADLLERIYCTYYNHYCIKTEDATLKVEDVIIWLRKLVNIILNTYDRYAVLLKAYDDNKNKLMDKIKSVTTGIAVFNDTPQNAGTDEEFGDDTTHRTNINKNRGESETDGNTLILRIKEIDDSFRNMMMIWLHEFDKIFYEEGNIE